MCNFVFTLASRLSSSPVTRSMTTSSNENIFSVTGHLCGKFTGHRWIPLTKASDAELWCFLWPEPELSFEAGDLRCHCAHYDVTVMICLYSVNPLSDFVVSCWWYISYALSSFASSNYCQACNTIYTKSRKLNVSCLVLQLSLLNPLKPGVGVKNEDVVGTVLTLDASTTSEWSTILLPTKVRLILEVWQYVFAIFIISGKIQLIQN